MSRACTVCLLLGLLAWPFPAAGADDAGRALDLVRKSYAALDGLAVRFVQVEERPGVGVTHREEGMLSFRPPDRMRWDYGGNRPHKVVINGSLVWIYTPSLNQVVRREMSPEELRRGPATFLTGLDGLERDFTFRSGPAAPDGGIPLDLSPRTDAMPFDRIALLVIPDTGLVKQLSIHHKLGNVTTITFHGFQTGVELSEDLFKWDVPDGTEVIEP